MPSFFQPGTLSAPSIVASSNFQRGEICACHKVWLRWWRIGEGRTHSFGSEARMLFSSIVFTFSLLLLCPLNLQGKIFRRHHLPRHNLEISTRWLPLSKSKDSSPRTQTNFDRTSEETDQLTQSKFDPNHQRLQAGAVETNLINSEDKQIILQKRHGYFKVMTITCISGGVKRIP